MSRLAALYSYIARVRRRLWLRASLRGLAVLAAVALAGTIIAVILLNRHAFSMHGVVAARFVLLAVLVAVAGVGLALPLVRLTSSRAVRAMEAAHPQLQQRLTTIYQQDRTTPGPFLELLAGDTLARTETIPTSSLVPGYILIGLALVVVACLSILLWMIAAAPGAWGYGASLIWRGPQKHVAPLYVIAVRPGNAAIRRHGDQAITAQVIGMPVEKVELFAHFQSALGWEPVAMQKQPDSKVGGAYQFILTGLPEDVEYYIVAGPLSSPHYKVRVIDLPSLKALKVTYNYPAWTGMKAAEDYAGDLRAIEGTDATIEVEMDRPLKDGQLSLDGGRSIHLVSEEGNRYRGTIHMANDGTYHVAGTDEGQPVRLSEDFFIATDKATPPEIALERPGRDFRASPIEEVTVGVRGAAQFGLRDMHLHYSVNGGPDRDVSLLKASGAKDAQGAYTLRLEDFKLVPGDLVSLYATVKDGHTEARTEITFIQADPFEREFSQSQQSGGGGGGGGQNNQTEISKREKELIAATWKQKNDKAAAAKDAIVQGQFLADAQQKLRDQVLALSARMQSRDLATANEEFTEFEKDMQIAAALMTPSAEQLKSTQWNEALPLEQKALQALLRAEATFRQIQVAFGQKGGGGGGGASAGRDLASLFDLELDTEKNQYETAQTASPEEQHAKDVNDALEKLDALANRQEELAQQSTKPQQSFEQRWQQEMLRREAEELQRQMQQLAQNTPVQQSSHGQKGSTSGAKSFGQGSQGKESASQGQAKAEQQEDQSSSKGGEPRIEQALSRLRQANDSMKRSGGSQQQNADAARLAADRLRDATNLLSSTQKQLATGKLDALSKEADHLAREERSQAEQIAQLGRQQNEAGGTDMSARIKTRNQLANERQELSNELSKLQQGVRTAARGISGEQPEVARKLRDALTEMDQSDLDNHVQRTADWLRRGINPNTSGTEGQIAQGLQKLSEQLREAQSQMGKGSGRERRGGQEDQTAALGQVARLRSQIEAMTRNGQANANGGKQPGSNRGQAGGSKAGGQQSDGGRTAVAGSGTQSGQVRSGGGGNEGAVAGNFNTGNNQYGQPGRRPEAKGAEENPADNERSYQEGMRELNQLRAMVQGDPQAQKELQELTRRMQQLDPKRFPGNPAMVEEMHREVLSAVDRLELQLQRRDNTSVARTGRPATIPAGYEDSVADYYRRLSAKQ